MKKHIGINEGVDDLERMALILHEERKAKSCKKPDYAMYPKGD